MEYLFIASYYRQFYTERKKYRINSSFVASKQKNALMSFQYGSQLVLIENGENKYDSESNRNICYDINKDLTYRLQKKTKHILAALPPLNVVPISCFERCAIFPHFVINKVFSTLTKRLKRLLSL